MEQYKKNEGLAPEIQSGHPEEILPQQAETPQDHTDKIKHSAEQSSSNIFSSLNSIQQVSTDDSVLPPVVDDSLANNVGSAEASKKINVDDEARLSDKDFERIWVDRARAIVNNTQGDPYMKSDSLAKAKNQYKMNPRFNKLISEH